MIQARVEDRWPAIHEINIPQPLTSVDGNPHIWETLALCQIAATVPARTAFEIGTYNGSTVTALSAVPGIERIWTLDLPPNQAPALPLAAGDWRYLGTPKLPLPAVVEQLWGDSATFDFGPYMRRCDLVFVMGAHSLEYIENDLAAAFMLKSPMGVVVLHTGTAKPMRDICLKYDTWLISDRMAVIDLGMNQEIGNSPVRSSGIHFPLRRNA